MEECQEEQEMARHSKLALVGAIKNIKQAAWAELCGLVNDDPWGKPYRLVMSRLGVRRPIPGIITQSRMEAIVDGLFPTQAIMSCREWSPDDPFSPVTVQEVQSLALDIPSNKAPGLDGIPGKALKITAKHRPDLLVGIFNKCLDKGVFPVAWKRARLLLVRKENKPLEVPSSYRQTAKKAFRLQTQMVL